MVIAQPTVKTSLSSAPARMSNLYATRPRLRVKLIRDPPPTSLHIYIRSAPDRMSNLYATRPRPHFKYTYMRPTRYIYSNRTRSLPYAL